MAYDVQPDGLVTHGREFVDGTARRAKGGKGAYDGMKLDQAGNLFTSAPGGLQIVSPAGKTLGMIVADTLISNCAWGDDGSTLYFTANHMVCRVKTKTRGDKFQAGAKEAAPKAFPRPPPYEAENLKRMKNDVHACNASNTASG